MTTLYEEIVAINNNLEEEIAIQKNVPYSDIEYRESIEREIKLLKEKGELVNKQLKDSEDQ